MNAETLLCNFFGSPYYHTLDDRESGVSIEIIEKCAKVLANNLPRYLFYDVTLKGITRAINEDNLYNLNRKLYYEKGKLYYNNSKIDLICNSCYPMDIANSITQIVNNFFIYKLYKKSIVLIHHVYQ